MAMAEDWAKRYDPKIEEPKWQKFWQENRLYRFEPEEEKEIYSVDTPPPTVSGRMHIGHAFSYAQEDFVVRFQRMNGRTVYYPFGTDDNGLPTERLVEKLNKVKSTRIPRQEFVKLCNDTIKEIKPDFIQDWVNMGMSCDFEGSYSTIDPHCQKTSQLSFIDLFNKGMVFQEEAPISWCTSCQTAIAQAEFESVDMTSHFNDLIFKSGEKELVIATTRPELLPACVALFFNPGDDKYKELEGKFAKVPLFDYDVPIMADKSVDKEKGTGLMMVCTFGDKEDIEKWHKYDLRLKIAITKDGRMNEEAGNYEGMKIKDARKAILEDLDSAGFLAAQKQIDHPVNVHDKCGTELEFLKTRQWFIKVLDKKNRLIEAADDIKWYPKHMKVRYVHWVENLNWNWCISRQRHFGVPFPVWYCRNCGKIIVADEKSLPVDPSNDNPGKRCSCGAADFESEQDVMDTWATSSVSPQIASNWAGKGGYDVDFKNAFPMSLRPQAHDIIRTWAFYTIVKALYNNNSVPWHNIMISGHALDPKGRKMSKSKGNVVDPRIMIGKYCADALRFWAAGSKLGEDLPFQEKDMMTGQKMINKLWNASKFTVMNLKDYDHKKPELRLMDKWLLSKLNRIIKETTSAFEDYEYSKTKLETEKFFWHVFCDNYLEVVKGRLYNPEEHGHDAKQAAQYTLYHSLLSILKLVAPVMPHITEAVYQNYFLEHERTKSIHLTSWPSVDDRMIDDNIEKAGDIIADVIGIVRRYKSERDINLNADVKEIVIECEEYLQHKLAEGFEDLRATTKAEDIAFGDGKIECDNFPGIKARVVMPEKKEVE